MGHTSVRRLSRPISAQLLYSCSVKDTKLILLHVYVVDLERRQVDIQERDYLKEQGVVTEMQCDLGLTALRSEDISDLLHKDYPEKYKVGTVIRFTLFHWL